MSQDTLMVLDRPYPLRFKRHRRAKNIKLSVQNSAIFVTLPYFVPKLFGKNFAQKNLSWIADQLRLSAKTVYSPAQIAHFKVSTRQLLKTRLPFFNSVYGFKYKRVIIRHQKTRWGSCSSSGTLSFNCKLALLPQALSDYVIVHELCHLQELNHSSRFWSLVARAVPHHKRLRAQLRRLSPHL